MPLKNPDPFASRAERLDATVNPYVATLRQAALDGSLPLAFGSMLAELPGRWRERIALARGKKPASLVLEIGCHKGQTLTAMAADAPETGFIGMDITYKRVVTTAERMKARGLTNVFLAMANAQAIDRLFAPGELDGVVIFFPDPWVKKARQAKNRLVNPDFVGRLASAVRSGGYVWLKTDQRVYFEEASEALNQGMFMAVDVAPGVPTVDYTSAFEQRYHAQNLPTYSGKWLRSERAPTLHA